MKKFLISFFIVAVFLVAVFFIGLASIRVEADTFGVLVSKTSGIDEEPIRNGEHHWKWELCLPTNCTIKTFKTTPYNAKKTVSGELPSGGFYASQYNVYEDFKYQFTYDISLVVSPENVIQLLKQNKISNDEDLSQYLSSVADSIAQQATDFILEKAFKNPDFRPERIRRDELTTSLSLNTEYPEVELSVFALTECIYPDYQLYKKLQQIGPLGLPSSSLDSSSNSSLNSSKEASNSSSYSSTTDSSSYNSSSSNTSSSTKKPSDNNSSNTTNYDSSFNYSNSYIGQTMGEVL